MSAKFTPGKWAAEFVGGSGEEHPDDVYEVVADTRVRVAEYLSAADAYLVSAAPDLYAALEDCLKYLQFDLPADVKNANQEISRAIAAIAKARGES